MTAEDLAHCRALAARWVAEENGDMLVADPASPVGWSVCEPLCTTERACLLAWVREFMAGKVAAMDHYPAGVKHAVLASLVGTALGLDVVRASWLCEAAGWPAKPGRYTGLIDLPDPVAREALADASAHVWRQQHAGRHTQDRVDAMAWRERFGIHGRCKCDTCERLWQTSRPA